MSESHKQPEIDPTVDEFLAVSALFINASLTLLDAEQEDVGNISRMRQMGRAITRRLVINETPDNDRPLTEMAVAVRSKRILLKPAPAFNHGIETIVMRSPRTPTPSLGILNNFFFEVVYEALPGNDQARERFVLSRTSEESHDGALYRYGTAADIAPAEDGRFLVAGNVYSEPVAYLKLMSRLIGEAGFGEQTSSDPTI